MLKIFVKAIIGLIPMVSPEIRKELIEFLKKLELKAKATPNPVDDIVMAVLIAVLEG